MYFPGHFCTRRFFRPICRWPWQRLHFTGLGLAITQSKWRFKWWFNQPDSSIRAPPAEYTDYWTTGFLDCQFVSLRGLIRRPLFWPYYQTWAEENAHFSLHTIFRFLGIHSVRLLRRNDLRNGLYCRILFGHHTSKWRSKTHFHIILRNTVPFNVLTSYNTNNQQIFLCLMQIWQWIFSFMFTVFFERLAKVFDKVLKELRFGILLYFLESCLYLYFLIFKSDFVLYFVEYASSLLLRVREIKNVWEDKRKP